MEEKKQIVLPPQAKDSGVKLTPPEGCEVDKTEVVNGALVVTFKPKEPQLPKSWEEFCEMFRITLKDCYIGSDSIIYTAPRFGNLRDKEEDKRFIPDLATAEAVLALCQLIQLRNCYNGDWVPDWKNGRETKFMIIIYEWEIDVDCSNSLPSSFLYFKTKELRDEFLKYFRPLIEKLKPLYGIMEGGEK